jgi:hypothetical protein
MTKSDAYQREIKGEDNSLQQDFEELLHSEDNEDDADIPMEIVHMAAMIPPEHLHDPSKSIEQDLNFENIPQGYQHSLRARGPICYYEESDTEDEVDQYNEEEERMEERVQERMEEQDENTLNLWRSKRSSGRTGGSKGGPSGKIPCNIDLL